MRYSADLAARAAAWLALPTEQKRGGDGSGLVELGAIWAAIQGLPPVKCLQCQYSDRVHDLQAYLREYHRFISTSSAMSDTQSTSTYQFVPAYAGQTLTDDSYGKAVTADNLTDEDAEHFIKRGFGHVFQKIGAAVEKLGEKLEGLGDGLASETVTVTPTQPLVPQADLEAEQAAHAATKQELAAEVEAYEQVKTGFNNLDAALAAEETAHATTKAQLADVQQQLATAQSVLAALPPAQLQKAMDKASGKTAPVDSSTDSSDATSPSLASASSPSTPTTADTDSTSSNGSPATGSN